MLSGNPVWQFVPSLIKIPFEVKNFAVDKGRAIASYQPNVRTCLNSLPLPGYLLLVPNIISIQESDPGLGSRAYSQV